MRIPALAYAGICAVVIAASACGPSEEEIQQEFDEYLAARNSCSDVSECTTVSPGCPLGCATGVNKNHAADVKAKAEELIDDYGSSCEYECVLTELACSDGRCETVPVEM